MRTRPFVLAFATLRILAIIFTLSLVPTLLANSAAAQSNHRDNGASFAWPSIFAALEAPEAQSLCPSKTSFYEADGGPYVTEQFTLGATANMDIYCHDVWHEICTGTIYFYVWGQGTWNELGAGTPTGECGWVLMTNALTAGNKLLKAVYTNDQWGYGPSSALTRLQVEKWPTTTTLASSPNPSSDKQSVTLTATAVPNQYAPYTPTGKIKFFDGDKVIYSVDIDQNGVAVLITHRLPVGTDSLTAAYFGDAYNAPSMSPEVDQIVNPEAAPASTTPNK